jgi:CRISPR-associated protein Cmr6
MAMTCYFREALPATDMNVSSFLKCKFIEKVEEGLKSQKNLHAEELSRELNRFRHDIAKEIADLYLRDKIANLLNLVRRHIDEVAKALTELGYNLVVNENYVTLTPLAIGLRNPYTEPLEISVSWEPYMNLPFIPGSSLKGAVASLAFLKRSKWHELLSSKKQASPIVFLDAYPVEVYGNRLLGVDIINPHYREVDGRISEAESRPTLLCFLVIPKGVAFRVMACATRRWLASYRGNPSLEELKTLIGQAFSRGVGAKTSLGYGRLAPRR